MVKKYLRYFQRKTEQNGSSGNPEGHKLNFFLISVKFDNDLFTNICVDSESDIN